MPVATPKGKMYEALTALSIGRTTTGKDSERLADIVHPHETVFLTDEQAHGFMTRHKVPVIRPASEQDEPARRITARDLFGAQPQAQQFGARPDPEGASRVIENPAPEGAKDPADPANHPEANGPVVTDPDAGKDA